MKKPNSWYNISIAQYKELIAESPENELDVLSILLDTPLGELGDMNINDLQDYLSGLNFISESLPTTSIDFEINGDVFYKKDLNSLTVGEFIDLEYLFTNDYMDNLSKIVAIVWRRELSNDRYNGQELEPYGMWLNKRGDIFEDEVGIGYVFPIITEYLKFRANIFKLYEGLFDGGGEDIDEEDIDEEETKRPKEKDNSGKWGWDIMLLKIANNDALKIEEASNIPLIQAFNVLAMRKELKIE
jgi:hypothetical protein